MQTNPNIEYLRTGDKQDSATGPVIPSTALSSTVGEENKELGDLPTSDSSSEDEPFREGGYGW